MSGTGTAAWMPSRSVQPIERTATARPTRPFRFGSEERADPDPALTAGAVVGERYRIIRLLGEGGMGRVYEAEHTLLRRRVALKLLRRDAQESSENLARFQQEALAASRIQAPQIVEVVDFASHAGPAGQQTYMVMELLAGESLEAWLAHEGRLDHALDLLAQLCDGLAAAHGAGVIHRDIKPANVFCCAPGPQLKILDFGIAKITEGGQGFQTQQGSLLGTPYYLAPERVMGAQLTAAADIYSVGVILYELLTGNVPFTAPSFVGILALHVHTEPLDPRQAAPDRMIPDALASLCMRLLAKDPARRPSADALAIELRAMLFAEQQALAGVRTGPREDVAGTGADTHVLPEVGAALAISERPTAPPSIHLQASAGAGRRGDAAVGYTSASSASAVVSVDTTQTDQARAGKRARRPWVLAICAALIAGGVGGAAAVAGVGRDREEAPAAPVAGSDQDQAPAVPPTASAFPDPAARASEPPEPHASAQVQPQPKPASAGVPEPAPADTKPEPQPEPKPTSKPDPKPDPKREDKPDPVEPKPAPVDPPPPKPDPKPSDAKPDPDLPTIKDDVYD